MARKRIIEVEVDGRSAGSAIGWMLAGSAVGVVAGVLVAEKMSGRSLKGRSLWREARSLLSLVAGRWEPLLDAAIDLRDAWAERRAAREGEGDTWEAELEGDEQDEDDLDEDDLDEDDLDDENLDEDDLDDDDLDDDDLDDDDLDDDAGHDEDDEPDDSAGATLGARVLEAFLNDPVLAERAVEIDADAEGGVFLHGTVRSPREVAHAVTIAGGVPGVRAVRQRLRVRTGGRR